MRASLSYLALLVWTVAITACTEHADGSCVWVPGDDGTCGSRGGGGGGGGSTSRPEYVSYSSATAVRAGATTYILAAQVDDRGADSIVIGAMREHGLPDAFEPWAVVEKPRKLRAWSGTDRALVAVDDVGGTSVIEMDAAGNPSAATDVAPFDDAAYDGTRWWVVRLESGPDLHEPDDRLELATMDGARRLEIVPSLVGRGVDLPSVIAVDGTILVAWREHDFTMMPVPSDAHVARIVDGEVLDVAAFAHERADQPVIAKLLLPDAIWIDRELVAFDGTRRSMMQDAPRTMVELDDGSFVGYGDYDGKRIFRYDGPIDDANYRILHTASTPIIALAPDANDFVALEGYLSPISATFSDGPELDTVVLLETTTYGGCSAGGGGGGLALVGLALLTCLRAHPPRSARRIAR